MKILIAKIKIKLAVVTLVALLLIGTLGTGMAAAGSGGGYVGGGLWCWSNIPHTFADSEYQHFDNKHSATAKVGSSSFKMIKPAGTWAIAQLWGWGTTYVYWSNNA